MKDEIKEILKYIDQFVYVDQTYNDMKLSKVDGKLILDYITNLQEENERLHTRIKTIKRRRKAQTAKMRKYREEITNKQNSIVDYKSRNEKANWWLKEMLKQAKSDETKAIINGTLELLLKEGK